MDALHLGDGYSLYSFQELEAAIAPVQARLEHVLAIAAGACLLAALALSAVSSRSIVKPIAKMDVYLRQAERTGTLPEFDGQGSRIREIRRLIQSFQRAAAAIRESRERLRRANLEFTASLASALDARDRYTAGHSERVSGFSCAIGKAMGMPAEAVEDLRIGALLHDIGKIGIADAVLQKPGKLSRDEFALIQAHPEIGCRILEGVHGFQAYLPIVGLHHENWDGSGYPRGLNGTDVPLGARIVHVADAFDAMTSDRPYRRGMSEPEATRALQQNAGTQFDPAIVRVFVELHLSSREQSATSLALLAQAVNEAGKHSLPVEGYVA
jgi:HD-GYP domain-containing protein (c-di-GMP phosphodiesterase class II)